jgi:hypothetical protein
VIPDVPFLTRQLDGISVAPNGKTVAVAADAISPNDEPNRIAYVDLATGRTSTWDPGQGASVHVGGFTSDMRIVIGVSHPGANDGSVWLLNPSEGTRTRLSPSAVFASAPSARYGATFATFSIGELSVQGLARVNLDGSGYRVFHTGGDLNFPVPTESPAYVLATKVGAPGLQTLVATSGP